MVVAAPSSGAYSVPLHVTAKTDYALRAVAELAAAPGRRIKAEAIASAQDIPLKFLLNILTDLRHARIVMSRRGSDGGFVLARPADRITVADVMRAVEGSLATVDGLRPEDAVYPGPAARLQDVWLAVQSSLEQVLGGITLAGLVDGSIDGSPPPNQP